MKLAYQTHRVTAASVLALFVVLLASPSIAAVPQTIVVDGVNDFDAANLLEDDGGDTEESNFCGDDPEVDTPMDIKEVYVTNDANNLYIGFVYDRECFSSPQVNLGMAFSYGDPADGGTTDPFSRRIAWNTIADKPDNYVYAVLDGFNYEVFYQWNGTGWDVVQDGSDGLGMANDVGFEEISIPLSWFSNGQAGLSGGQNLKIELWMTQDGTSKPPLDALASDDVQTSTPSGTTFDVSTDVEMTAYLDYTVIDVVDNEAPLLTGVSLVDGAAGTYRLTYNEPVEQASAEALINYSIGGVNPISATRTSNSVVEVVFDSGDGATAGSATNLQLDINGVQDPSGNTLNGSFDVAVKELVFEGLFGPFLQNNATGPDDFFTVEGSRSPLDFILAEGDDEMALFDAENDVYRLPVSFAFYVGPSGGTPVTSSIALEWKFGFNGVQFESRSNREAIIAVGDEGSRVISRFWDDLDPSQFTTTDIDVIFSVDMNALDIQAGDTVELAGNVLPLSFDSPYTPLLDDGAGQDATAGDGIYTTVVTFPAGSLKNVNYKYVFNANFECFGQGDRTVFLNDEEFDTIGGTNGPIVLPVATYDRCTVVAGDTEVVFAVDITGSGYDVDPPLNFDVLVAGNVAPLSFDLNGVEAAPVAMFDDGVAPDDTAGDLIYTTSVVFPDSSNRFLEYKYVVGDEFEGQGLPNRNVVLSDEFDASGNPQVLGVDELNFTVPTNVDTPVRPERMAVKAVPNPFNPQTSIVFEMPSRADVTVEIFDSRGRLVRTLYQGVLGAGQQSRTWDGRGDSGQLVASGVYFARVVGGGYAASTRLVLVK
ncbi:MAG TPA: choice-of-anchor X domain-containing protein [Candidatus Krumholzibacteria bacterium]|nr:choice-of-anchor X domain-containing protein [Candidatus Krumholzibacteria bacterium]